MSFDACSLHSSSSSNGDTALPESATKKAEKVSFGACSSTLAEMAIQHAIAVTSLTTLSGITARKG